MWTVFLVFWLGIMVTGLAASGYGIFELFVAHREPRSNEPQETPAEEKPEQLEEEEVQSKVIEEEEFEIDL